MVGVWPRLPADVRLINIINATIYIKYCGGGASDTRRQIARNDRVFVGVSLSLSLIINPSKMRQSKCTRTHVNNLRLIEANDVAL